jgi:hypothetical protein
MFKFTKQEYNDIIAKAFVSLDPPLIRVFPTKEKRKFITLFEFVKVFKQDETYTEIEVNEIIRPIYPDYATIRRYLVDYRFLSRTANGSKYWVENRDFPECHLQED